jgi:hypothetical protein
MQASGLITVVPAMGGKHIVNCPFFEPSTVFEHQGKLLSGTDEPSNIVEK